MTLNRLHSLSEPNFLRVVEALKSVFDRGEVSRAEMLRFLNQAFEPSRGDAAQRAAAVKAVGGGPP